MPWPPPWTYKPPSRLLGWASGGSSGRGMVAFEDGRSATYRTKAELEKLLFTHNAYLLMPDWEFGYWVKAFVRAGGQCVYADAANRIVGFRVKRGSKVRYVYNAASAWPGMEQLGAGGLPRLRAFLDGWGLGDLSTPGALGLRLAETMIGPLSERFWRPPWPAWHDLHEHGVAGWAELFMRYRGESCVTLDQNSAYPAASRSGMPAGRCTRIYDEDDAKEEAWTFGRYEWRLSPDPDVVKREQYLVLALTHHDNAGTAGGGGVEPGASGAGWYTRVEVEAARESGAFDQFELREGWGWSAVSSAFAEWSERLDAEKVRLKTLGESAEVELGWVKRMSVAPFGRFFMDAHQASVWEPGQVEAEGPVWSQEYSGHEVSYQVVKTPCAPTEPTKLPQLAIHVWTTTRIGLARTCQEAKEAGWQIFMVAIDGVYGKPKAMRPLGLVYGTRVGEWKQQQLLGVDISAAGHVRATLEDGRKYEKLPGIPRGDPRRKGLTGP